MDMNRLTEKAQEALVAARDLAARNGQQQIEAEHLLLALLEQEGSVARAVAERAGVRPAALQEGARREVGRLPKVSGSGADPHPGPRLNRVLLNAEDQAKALKDDFVAAEHLLLAL